MMQSTTDIDISEEIIQKWQNIVDIMAELIHVPAGLIMRIQDSEIEVFVSSQTPNNPYQVGTKDHLKDSGLYCETVIKTQQKLIVPNAEKSEQWRNNPDIKLGMISYLGYPLILPDGRVFGTICVLDLKENDYSQLYEKLLIQFKDLIENHLSLLVKTQELKNIAIKDCLTGLYNRKYFFEIGEQVYQDAVAKSRSLAIIMIDIDWFKKINDTYGHSAGDFVLKEFANLLLQKTRPVDIVARFGGEEFCLLLPDSTLEEANLICEKIRYDLQMQIFSYENHQIYITMSCGISGILEDSLEQMLKQADHQLYQAKHKGRNRICF